MTDKLTLEIYGKKAKDYVNMIATDKPNCHLRAFIAAVPKAGHALDIGCGPGHSAAAMRAAGLTVTAIDPSPEMSILGKERFGIDITQGSYEDITEKAHYDGIWSSFSMLHVLRTDVPKHLNAIKRALKPNGILVIGVKKGTGEARDSIGRLYTYFTRNELDTLLCNAGLTPTDHFEGSEAGLAGTIDPFIIVTAYA